VANVVQPLQSVNCHDAVLMVMSDMDLSHDNLGFWFGLDLVGLDYGVQQV
jgi:hypothetical protein